MIDPLLKTCFAHLLEMGWILIAHWAISVKNEDVTPIFSNIAFFILPGLAMELVI
jgi:hypothetical protein